MSRYFVVGPHAGYHWTGRCEVREDSPSMYAHHHSWPVLSPLLSPFIVETLASLLARQAWVEVEDIPEDMKLVEGL